MLTRPRVLRALLLALPGVSMAVVGFFHPHHFNYGTARQWEDIHIPGVFAFPLVGIALMELVHGRRDLVAWAVRISAYVYATFYTALDAISGIANGYLIRQAGPGVHWPIQVHQLFALGTPLGRIGSVALIICTVIVALDALLRHRLPAIGGVLLVPGALYVNADHIFSPLGVLGMFLIAAGTAAVALAVPRDARVHKESAADMQPNGAARSL